ncbi:MAG: beta-ketoacyl-ACP synthase III [Phycisphaerae bacterium]
MTQALPVEICGTGSYLPAEVVSNQYYIDRLDTSEEWIVSRTGIRQRHRAAPEEATSDLAINAARLALDDAGLRASDLDAIICATATGDHPFPATATLIQAGLGAEGVPAFDLSAACAGFIYGAATAAGFLGSGVYERVLVVGAETLTRYTDPQDRGTVILLGDAAGAAVFQRSTSGEHSILHCALGCDGTRAKHIWIPSGGSRLPVSEQTLAERLQYMRMRGREVYKFAVVKMQRMIEDALEATGLAVGDIKLFIPHQSNLRIIDSVRDRLGLPEEKIAVNIDRCGNTSAASVPMALDEGRRSGLLQPGDIVVMAAIGAGLAWGSMVIKL